MEAEEAGFAPAARRLAISPPAVTRAIAALELRAGQLRIVLEDFEPPPIPIHVVYPKGRRANARVRAFVDFAVERLRAEKSLNP